MLEIQEDVGLLDKKDYMCCFCMSSRTLSLVREIKSLWEEVERMHKQNKCGSKEGSSSTKLKGTNTDEISCTDNNRSSREATLLYSAMVKSKERHPKKKSQTRRKQEDPQPVTTNNRKKVTVEPSQINATRTRKPHLHLEQRNMWVGGSYGEPN